MTSAAQPAPAHGIVSLGALWFGLFGAPVAWSIQELAGAAVVGHSCYPHWEPLTVPSIAGTWTVALVISLVTLALGGLAGLTAWRSWRETRPRPGEAEAQQVELGEGRVRFMALSGLLVSGMVLFNMVLNLLALFLVPACG